MLSIGPDFREISAMLSTRIRTSWLWLALVMLAGCASSGRRPENSSSMNLHLRSQNGGASGVIVASERVESWDPHRTAIIVCDMWDDHWCKSASSRVGELIEPMNRTLEAARKKGVFIIHAPSSVTDLTAASFSLVTALSSLSRSRASSGSWMCLRRTREPASSIRSMALSGRNRSCTYRSASVDAAVSAPSEIDTLWNAS
jgi:hypothetical protein